MMIAVRVEHTQGGNLGGLVIVLDPRESAVTRTAEPSPGKNGVLHLGFHLGDRVQFKNPKGSGMSAGVVLTFLSEEQEEQISAIRAQFPPH